MQSFIEIGGKVNDTFRRNIIIKKEDKEEAIKKYHFKDTYSTIYEYDDKVVNSYNLDTKIITPMQLVRGCNSGYKSNHNELVLDSSKIIEIGIYEKKVK